MVDRTCTVPEDDTLDNLNAEATDDNASYKEKTGVQSGVTSDGHVASGARRCMG